jgi:filamentous hemagglutinin
MTKLPHAEISTEIRDEIIGIPKGQKPDPSVYMSSSEIKKHLSLFDDWAVRIQSKESFKKAKHLYGSNIGDHAKGTFVLPKSIDNKTVEASNGNPRILKNFRIRSWVFRRISNYIGCK